MFRSLLHRREHAPGLRGGYLRLAVVLKFLLLWTLSTLRFGSLLRPWSE